jgi:hypothetical protein
MSELHLGEKLPADYGNRYSGIVETEDRNIEITWREPPKPDRAKAIYVLVNGLTAAKSSMRVPAIEAVRDNNYSLTFNYTNKSVLHPIEKNVDDLVAVVDSLPSELGRRGIGLSMGGRVLTESVPKTLLPLESATMVASAGYIREHVSYKEALQHFVSTAPELADLLIKHPIQALHVGGTAVNNCIHRNKAVAAELVQLINGTVHHLIPHIKAHHDSPHMRFMYGDSDPLLPPEYQAKGVHGLPFDHVEMYSGGHLTFVSDPSLSRRIFELDEQVLEPSYTPLPDDSRLAA